MTPEEKAVVDASEHLHAVYAIATERLINARKRLEGKCTHPEEHLEPYGKYGMLCNLCLSVNYWNRDNRKTSSWRSRDEQRKDAEYCDRD